MELNWLNKSSFLFDDIDMYQTFGISLADDGMPQDVLMPSLRPRKVMIPLRSGSYDFGAKYYDDRPIQFTAVTVKAGTRDDAREMAYVLSKKSQIRFWNEPDKYYIGRVYQAPGLEVLRKIGNRFTLSFELEPFAYGETTTKPFDENLTHAVSYKGTAEAPTYIVITNTGNATATNIRISMIDKRENY